MLIFPLQPFFMHKFLARKKIVHETGPIMAIEALALGQKKMIVKEEFEI